METRFSFIFRIMGGTADGENNQDWTAERTTGKIPCNLCGYLYLWWSSGRRQVQLYSTSGELWWSKAENITKKSKKEGIYYRVTINILEE